jgi:hypothetical protein
VILYVAIRMPIAAPIRRAFAKAASRLTMRSRLATLCAPSSEMSLRAMTAQLDRLAPPRFENLVQPGDLEDPLHVATRILNEHSVLVAGVLVDRHQRAQTG